MKFNLLYKATLYLLNFIYTFLSKQITKYHFLGNILNHLKNIHLNIL